MFVNDEIVFEQVKINKKKLVFFGTGSFAKKIILDNVWIYDYIAYFVSSSPNGDTFMGKKVESFEAFKRGNVKDYFVVVASSFFHEIYKLLNDIGLIENINYTQIYQLPINYDTTKKRIINGVLVGKYSYGFTKHCFKGSLLKEIGSYCSINESARIGEVNHPLSFITTHPLLYTAEDELMASKEGVPGFISKENTIDVYQLESNGEIIIENDVWIGAQAIILPNVTIHNGAVIAAGAVVTKDVPPYAIVGGVPARIIRFRFTPEEIEILLRVKWWEWPEEKIQENIELLKKPSLFFEKYNSEK